MTRELSHPTSIVDTQPTDTDTTAGQRVIELGEWLHEHDRTFTPFGISFYFDEDGAVQQAILSGETA